VNSSVLELLSVIGRLPLSGEQSFLEAARLSLASAQDAFPIRPLRRNLEGLGHVHCSFRTAREVEVLSPRLCLLPGGNAGSCTAVLAGARTARLVDELKFVADCDPTIRIKYSPMESVLPERILVSGSYQSLVNVAAKVRIQIGDDPATPDAWLLLQQIEPLPLQIQAYLGGTVPFDVICSPSATFHAYDPGSGAPVPWPELATKCSPPLLLLRKAPYDYRFARRIVGNRWRLFLPRLSLDPAWGMWAVRLAALPAEASLAPPDTWTFRVPVACPLPLSLHQVCCLCSGFIPERANGYLEYPEVPPIIQKVISQRLSLGALLQES
jgi:hypothetical protein